MAVADTMPVLPFERSSVLELAPTYRLLLKERPISRVRTPVGDEGWLITGHEQVKYLLGEVSLGRAHPDPENAPRLAGSAINGGPIGDFESERVDHARMRKVMTRSFMVKRMNALRPRVQELVDSLLDQFTARERPADLHEGLAAPLPVLVICELLGVPYEDRDQFRAWSEAMTDTRDQAAAAAGFSSLYLYMGELLERKKAHLTEDVLSDFIRNREQDGLRDDEMVFYATALLWAGHETTVARIDMGSLLLLTHPEERAKLQADPAGLAVGAVEEIMRFGSSSMGALLRYASEDIELDGVAIRAGDLVLLGLDAANHDPSVFSDPDRFDITRQGSAGQHMGFGHGVRFCLGAGLARVELQVVFGTLFQRLPTLELAVPLDAVRVKEDNMTGGLHELPVTW